MQQSIRIDAENVEVIPTGIALNNFIMHITQAQIKMERCLPTEMIPNGGNKNSQILLLC